MKIVTRDERMFQGTPLQIVQAMQRIAFGVADLTIPKYIEWLLANALRFEDVRMSVEGANDEELASSLVSEMIRTGLVKKV